MWNFGRKPEPETPELDPVEQFGREVRAEADVRGCSRIQAVRAVAVRNPALHKAYLKATNHRRSHAVIENRPPHDKSEHRSQENKEYRWSKDRRRRFVVMVVLFLLVGTGSVFSAAAALRSAYEAGESERAALEASARCEQLVIERGEMRLALYKAAAKLEVLKWQLWGADLLASLRARELARYEWEVKRWGDEIARQINSLRAVVEKEKSRPCGCHLCKCHPCRCR